MKIRFVSLVLIAASLLVASCQKPKPETHGIVTFVSGKVTVVRDGKSQRALLNQRVRQGDTIKTKNRSKATLQFGETAVVLVLANTELVLSSLNKGGLIDVNNQEGKVFSKIAKLSKEERFRVSTPTAVAGVRGTEFLSTVLRGKSKFLVREGKVAVSPPVPKELIKVDTPPAEKEKIIREHMNKKASVVSAGKLAVVKVDPKKPEKSEKVAVRKQSKVEKLNVKKIVTVAKFVEKVEKKTEAELKKRQKKIERKEKKKRKSIDLQIRKVENKRRAEVLLVLKDGSKMKGHILEQDENIIKLDDGVDIIKLEKADIIRREQVR